MIIDGWIANVFELLVALAPACFERLICGTGGRGGTQLEVRTQNNILCNRSKEFKVIHLDQILAGPWVT